MADITTPDSVFNQDYRTRSNLQPAAHPISVYQGATRADVAAAPQGNQYSQLGHALEKFTAGAGIMLTRDAAERQAKADLVAGKAASERMQKANVKQIDEAVQRKIIPVGASPVYLQALAENQLAYAADKKRQSLNEAYWSPENADLRASNDASKFNGFVNKHNAEFDQSTLLDKNGAPMYSDLDMHRSKYADKTREAVNSAYSDHLKYRVSENERAGEEIAGLRATKALSDGLDAGHDHATIAANIGSIFRDENTGLVIHGMKASKQTEITVDAVIDAAVERRDPKVLDMLGSMKTDGNSTLAGTSYAKKKVETARLHIANETWMEGERSRIQAERRGAGVATDPEAEAREKETRDRNEAEYAVKVKQLAHQGSSLDKAVQAEPEQAAIMKHLANGSSAFDPEVIGHLKNLAKIDPTAGQQMMTFVQTQQAKQKSAVDEQSTLHTFTRLRADLSNDPSKFDRGRIIQEANQGHLTAGQVSSLYENAEAATKAYSDFPVLQSELIKTMRTDIRAASMTNPLDEFGSGRLRADAAANEFNDLVLDYVKTHPTAGAYEISKAMRPEVERLARRHNAELDTNITRDETKAKNDQLHAEQDRAKTEREQSFLKDSTERDTLRGQLSTRYPNKRQLETVIDQILANKQGKK